MSQCRAPAWPQHPAAPGSGLSGQRTCQAAEANRPGCAHAAPQPQGWARLPQPCPGFLCMDPAGPPPARLLLQHPWFLPNHLYGFCQATFFTGQPSPALCTAGSYRLPGGAAGRLSCSNRTSLLATAIKMPPSFCSNFVWHLLLGNGRRGEQKQPSRARVCPS